MASHPKHKVETLICFKYLPLYTSIPAATYSQEIFKDLQLLAVFFGEELLKNVEGKYV